MLALPAYRRGNPDLQASDAKVRGRVTDGRNEHQADHGGGDLVRRSWVETRCRAACRCSSCSSHADLQHSSSRSTLRWISDPAAPAGPGCPQTQDQTTRPAECVFSGSARATLPDTITTRATLALHERSGFLLQPVPEGFFSPKASFGGRNDRGPTPAWFQQGAHQSDKSFISVSCPQNPTDFTPDLSLSQPH